MADLRMVRVNIYQTVRETHEVEYDHEEFVTWLEGEEPEGEDLKLRLSQFLESGKDWDEQFTQESLLSAEPYDTEMDGVE